MRAMLDTMVFDALDADPDGCRAVRDAVRHHRLTLLSTPVQESQLAAVPDPARRKRLQRTVPREAVPVAGLAPPPGHRHSADAAILDTAAARADVLVTEDRRLREAAAEDGVRVWRVAELVAYARDASAAAAA